MFALDRAMARRAALALLCAFAALIVLAATPHRAQAASAQCASTFRVLHDDHIGRLSLVHGNYRITLLDAGRLSCERAAALFIRFLEDFDGRLPGGWRVGVASSSFSQAAGVGFRVARVGGAGGTGGGQELPGGEGIHPAGGRRCPATFRVLHNDQIGRLRLPKGSYNIFLLQRHGFTCPMAAAFFGRFLELFEGSLPAPWLLEPHTASFLRGAAGPGFRVKPAA
ncbi:MAG TPA: hypothetical protein VEQ41_06450 [Solirubrobacterales bacterium]|nr:hypothetical protein [Solirubrobacterales bacterium]